MRTRVIGVSVAGKTVVAIMSWEGLELPRARDGNLGLCGRRSSETACEEDGTDKLSSRLRPVSLKLFLHKLYFIILIQYYIHFTKIITFQSNYYKQIVTNVMIAQYFNYIYNSFIKTKVGTYRHKFY